METNQALGSATDSSSDSSSEALEQAGFAFVDSLRFTDPDSWHDSALLLRRERPIHWVDHPNFYPFWVLTRHRDVMEVERNSELFLAAPRGTLGTKAREDRRAAKGRLASSLVNMDGEQHKALRSLAATWFRPSSLRAFTAQLDEFSDRAIARLEAGGGEIDFARDVSMAFPLHVIMAMMGLPESDYDFMLKLTQETFGSEDPELARSGAPGPASLEETVRDFARYFREVAADRRANPTDDYCSSIANGTIDGEPLDEFDQIGLYMIAATAGHDTTSHAISGGLHALISHPDQLARLRAEPELIDTAVEEMLRWVSPTKHFMRTAAQDYELSGTKIAAGEHVLLSYWSANRDEDVFVDPFVFDVGRRPNPHIAFGFGAHFCLGAMLARMEMKSLFSRLIPRLESVELAGDPAISQSNFVSGLKRLPIRYSLTPS